MCVHISASLLHLTIFFNKISLKSFYINSCSAFSFFTQLRGKWRHFDLNSRKRNTDVNQTPSALIFYSEASMSWFFMNNNDDKYDLRILSCALATELYALYALFYTILSNPTQQKPRSYLINENTEALRAWVCNSFLLSSPCSETLYNLSSPLVVLWSPCVTESTPPQFAHHASRPLRPPPLLPPPVPCLAETLHGCLPSFNSPMWPSSSSPSTPSLSGEQRCLPWLALARGPSLSTELSLSSQHSCPLLLPLSNLWVLAGAGGMSDISMSVWKAGGTLGVRPRPEISRTLRAFSRGTWLLPLVGLHCLHYTLLLYP